MAIKNIAKTRLVQETKNGKYIVEETFCRSIFVGDSCAPNFNKNETHLPGGTKKAKRHFCKNKIFIQNPQNHLVSLCNRQL